MSNILQNGYKSSDSIIAAFSPKTVEGKDQINVEAQKDNADGVLLNTDYALPQTVLQNNNILALKINQNAKKLNDEAIANAQMVDFEKRKAGTFEGIGMDFGMKFDDVVQLMVRLSQHVDDNGVPLIDDKGQTYLALVAHYGDLQEYRDTGKVSDRLASNANAIKDSFYAELKTAKDKYYWSDPENAGKTTLMDEMEKALANLSVLSQLAVKGPEDSFELIKQRIISTSNSVYSYVKSEDVSASSRTSANAKSRLINNPWYLGYVEAIKDSSPGLFDALNASSQVNSITDTESKVIREIMNNASEIRRQKDILEEELGWEAMNEIFEAPQQNGASFNDLLQLQWDLNKTALDDEIENSIGSMGKLSMGYDNYLDSNVSFAGTVGNLASVDNTPVQDKPDKGFYQFQDANYESDKEKSVLLGLEISQKDYDKIAYNNYADIRESNLKELLYDKSPESDQQ